MLKNKAETCQATVGIRPWALLPATSMRIYGILEVNQKLPRPLLSWRCDFHEFTAFQGTLSVESPRSESLGNSVSPEIAMHIQGSHVEILHMWDMSTTRNRLCMRCGFREFRF